MEFYSDIGGSDTLKPSIFELVAQEQLRDLLQPALKYVLAVFAQRYPRYLLRLVNRHEEFYAGLMVIVEHYYLRKYNASFAENFYGLKRRRKPWLETPRAQAASGAIPSGEKLRDKEVLRSLIFLVGVPYLKAKAQDYFEELGGGLEADMIDDDDMDSSRARTHSDNTLTARLKRAYRKVYPWLSISFEIWLLAYNIAYLLNQTTSYRPWLSWIGVDIRRLGIEDYRAAASLASKSPRRAASPQQGLLSMMRSRAGYLPRLLLDSLRLMLPTAIFFVKFLEWWYSPGSPAKALITSPLGPAVPPPRMLRPHPKGIGFDPKRYGICPICEQNINNATALPSGYVFCYRCAFDEVEKRGKCPVTLLPAKVWQLRKVLV